MQIANKVFVVTGGGNGMGRQVVLEIARRGGRVAAVDLSEDGLSETIRLAGDDNRVTPHTIDVTDRSAVSTLPGQVADAHGQIDGVVNIAGIIHRFSQFIDLSDDEIERIMNVNFWGTVNMCRTFLPVLLERPTASLVNMSSLSALIPFASQTFYGASKGAVKQFSEGLYAELIDTEVAVTTVFPGNISTNLTGNSGVPMIDTSGQKVQSTTPEQAGKEIVEGIAKGSFRVLIGKDARQLDLLTRFSAKHATRLVAKRMKSVLKHSTP
jgi:short-subunit dehydrogenase